MVFYLGVGAKPLIAECGAKLFRHYDIVHQATLNVATSADSKLSLAQVCHVKVIYLARPSLLKGAETLTCKMTKLTPPEEVSVQG